MIQLNLICYTQSNLCWKIHEIGLDFKIRLVLFFGSNMDLLNLNPILHNPIQSIYFFGLIQILYSITRSEHNIGFESLYLENGDPI